MDEPTKTCKYCKSSIDKAAKRCPQCSGDLRSWQTKHPVVSIFLFVFVVLPLLTDGGTLLNVESCAGQSTTSSTLGKTKRTSTSAARHGSTSAARTSVPAPKQYVEIYSTSGSGNRDTESFTTTGGKLKMVARVYNAHIGIGSFSSIELRSESGGFLSGADLDLATDKNEAEKTGETIIRAPAGQYYISAISGISWEVHIYEEK